MSGRMDSRGLLLPDGVSLPSRALYALEKLDRQLIEIVGPDVMSRSMTVVQPDPGRYDDG